MAIDRLVNNSNAKLGDRMDLHDPAGRYLGHWLCTVAAVRGVHDGMWEWNPCLL